MASRLVAWWMGFWPALSLQALLWVGRLGREVTFLAHSVRSRDRSLRLSAPPPWLGRAGRPAPSVTHANLRARLGSRWDRSGTPLRLALAFRLQHRLRHLLHEQRDAVGTLDNVLPNVCRQQLAAGNVVNHRVYVTMSQPVQGKRRYMGLSNPRSLELRSKCHDHQHAKRRDPIRYAAKRFQARRVSVQCASSKTG